jgi:hypothetical protein
MRFRDHHRFSYLLFPMFLVAGASAPAARADQSANAEPRNEIVVFGGASLLDATNGTTKTVSLPDGSGFLPQVFPNRPNIVFPPIPPLSFNLQTATSVGDSALVGFRYSRALKKRLWIEVDLEVEPSHDLKATGSVCLQGGQCLGSGDLGGIGGGRLFPELNLNPAPARPVTAWNYGGGLAYELTGGDVRPLLIFGAGGVSWSGSRESATNFVLRFGAGLKVLFGRAGFRVEGVDYYIPDLFLNGKSAHDVHVTGGLLVRF